MTTHDDVLGKPRSFEEIEAISIAFRKNYGFKPDDNINIVDFIDRNFSEDFPHFALIPVSAEAIGGDKARAEFSPICIKCREDIYRDASLGIEGAKDVIAHELGHIVLHERVLSKPLRNDGQMRFGLTNAKHWSTEAQADQFAVAFLIPRVVALRFPNPYLLSRKLCVSIEYASLALDLYKAKIVKLMPYQRMDLECWEA